MIAILQRDKSMFAHCHVQECDGIHMEDHKDEDRKIWYTEIIVYKDGECVAEWHAGRGSSDVFTLKDGDKTILKMFLDPVKLEKHEDRQD